MLLGPLGGRRTRCFLGHLPFLAEERHYLYYSYSGCATDSHGSPFPFLEVMRSVDSPYMEGLFPRSLVPVIWFPWLPMVLSSIFLFSC